MSTENPVELQRVIVTNVDISFGNMVWLLVKFVLASIPAAIIIFLFAMFAAAVLRSVGMGH